jgi:dephospho-CoA kinase
MTFLLGLTGGIASGKSTVSDYFKGKGIPVIDADLVAYEVMDAGQPAVAEIEKTFGSDVILSNGDVNRLKLGRIVFGDDKKRHQLNGIVHPAIVKKMQEDKDRLMAENHPLLVFDIPLLYEGKSENNVDQVMVVYVDEETQLERLLARNSELTKEDALNRINAQMSLEEKAKRADVLIDNRGTRQATFQQVENWLHKNFPEREQ